MNWKDLFYNPLKIKADPKSVLFTGCLHYGHRPSWENPIWKMRGYNSPEEHEKGLVDNWNSKADEKTIGFLLGDNVFGDKDGAKFHSLMEQLNFETVYVMGGNHYSGFRQNLEMVEKNRMDLGRKSVIFTPNYLEAFVNSQPIVMSHYPILSWNGQAKGSVHLHSHTHGRLGDSAVGKAYKESGAKVIEVSIEVHPIPLNFADIQKHFEGKPAVSFDHHDAATQNPF